MTEPTSFAASSVIASITGAAGEGSAGSAGVGAAGSVGSGGGGLSTMNVRTVRQCLPAVKASRQRAGSFCPYCNTSSPPGSPQDRRGDAGQGAGEGTLPSERRPRGPTAYALPPGSDVWPIGRHGLHTRRGEVLH